MGSKRLTPTIVGKIASKRLLLLLLWSFCCFFSFDTPWVLVYSYCEIIVSIRDLFLCISSVAAELFWQKSLKEMQNTMSTVCLF